MGANPTWLWINSPSAASWPHSSLQEVNTFTDQERFWAGPADEYQYVAAHSIAGAFYATPPGAAVLAELAAPAAAEKAGHAELATHT